MSFLIYVQNTGELFDSGSPELQPILRGYSGAGEHKNRPDSQCVSNLGPIPKGWYDMSRAQDIDTLTCAIRLTPDSSNDMCGRSGFLIHGDSKSAPGWASEGCIVIQSPDARARLADNFRRLQVIQTRPSTIAQRIKSLDPLFPGHNDPGASAEPPAVPVPTAVRQSLLGYGYRSFSHTFANRALAIDSVVTPIHGAVNQVKFGLVASEDTFERAFSADAELSGAYGAVSGDLKASFSTQYSKSLIEVSLAFSKQVTLGTHRIEDPRALDAMAQQTLQESASGVRDYLQAYGDEIVTAVSVGGACCWIMKIVFSSEKEASDFKASAGMQYGAFSGSVSTELKTLMTKVHAAISLKGYSTGTIQVPKLLRSKPAGSGLSFLFDSKFSADMLLNVLEYFDKFETFFTDDPETSSRYSQVVAGRTPLFNMPAPLFGSKRAELIEIASECRSVADSLSQQLDAVQSVRNQLDYMQHSLQRFNTSASLQEASRLQGVTSDVLARIEARQARLEEHMDTESPADFRADLPAIPDAFCTLDPSPDPLAEEVRADRWVLYQLPVDQVAQGRRTLRIEAQWTGYVSGINTGWAETKIRLLKRRPDSHRQYGPITLGDDGSSDWEVVDERYSRFGPDQGAVHLVLNPVVIIPAIDGTYAVAAYTWPNSKLSMSALNVNTYVSIHD